MIRKLAVITGALAFVASINGNAWALTINDPGVVGAFGITSGGTAELTIAQTLLNMDPATSSPTGCDLQTECYQTANQDYAGTLSFAGQGGGTNISLPTDGSFDYILVKYDGAEAGYVLFYTGNLTGTFVVPSPSFPLWTDQTSQYVANGWSAYTCTTSVCGAVPDGGSTSALLGSALFAMGVLARRFRKA